jgi:hypothetical protein
VPTGQLVACLQLSLSEGLARFDVLDRADGQAFDIDPVQRILTIRAATTIVTRLVVLETSASVGTATCLAVAVVFLLQNHAPWQDGELPHVSGEVLSVRLPRFSVGPLHQLLGPG